MRAPHPVPVSRLACWPLLAALVLLPGILRAQADTARWVLIAPNAEYEAGTLKRALLGKDYRDLWVVPTKVDVLDLGTFAGGLTPVRAGGGQQTKSLRLKDPSGREWSFRSVDKDPGSVLPEDLQGTIAEDIVRDQVSSALPGGPLVVDPLFAAAGVINASHTMYVMPDDPRLGEFRAVFGGMLGIIEEHPNEGAPISTRGLENASKIIDMDNLLERLEDDPAEHIDTLAYLKARLMDIFIGDWDRHRGQWSWARIGPDQSSTPWVPVPEDRDQAFIRYDGFLLSIARHSYAQLVNYGPDYARIRGATYNGRELDRRLLESVDRPVWDSIANDLKRRLTDQVIDSAVRRLPIQEYRIMGEHLAQWIRSRRDQIPKAAERFYRFLAEAAELHGTDRSDRVTMTRLPSGEVEVLMEAPGDNGMIRQAHRTFRNADTEEVRIYLHGGDDTVRVSGPGSGSIRIRLIGGNGHDAVFDSTDAGKVRMYDTDRNTTLVSRRKIRYNGKRYTWPDTTSKVGPVDWGGYVDPVAWASVGPDLGLFVGTGFMAKKFGFRKDPFASRQVLRAGYATTAQTYRAEFRGIWHKENSRGNTSLLVRASGIEILRFHGFGNESAAGDDDFFKVQSNQFLLEPGITFRFGQVAWTIGPRAQFTTLDDNSDRFIATIPNLYGAGDFGEIGVRSNITIDTRDVRAAARKGVLIELEGTVYPGIWDVVTTFGKVSGLASTYLSAGPATLALRAGGEKVFGDFPWFESAFLGGRTTIRGWHEQRFAGDASAYGNAELRLHVARVPIVVPADVGIFGLADVGRVYLDGETSDEWHSSFGGGISLGFLSRINTITVAVAKSDEKTGLYLRAGFLF